ncbi:TetR/AcrR family transcriptional regulator [Amnibacterium setariae]|uniref:TetR/AcrR family transcriptional regulator n=1 Tax=Amnibacterium setariae TaxID=2306585 RepID=A0A3A1TYA3_9MICO|nr:TetR/AcrR family transcriptional regulator [Amnibacterium setariae]RIX28561.1 TetR/AcrR family transcriptional regulator [Amnibacterium setariae]
MDEDGPKRLRADAAQNADRLLAAAVRAGLGEGRPVPMARIAADAGVGIGTLYRRFPNREALLEAMQQRAAGILIEVAQDALAEGGTGLDAIGRFLRRSFEHRDELVLPLHGAPAFDGPETVALRERLRTALAALVERGHDDGSVRSDVTAGTVVRFGAMLAQPMTAVQGWAELAEEQRRIFLLGIAARREDPSR